MLQAVPLMTALSYSILTITWRQMPVAGFGISRICAFQCGKRLFSELHKNCHLFFRAHAKMKKASCLLSSQVLFVQKLLPASIGVSSGLLYHRPSRITLPMRHYSLDLDSTDIPNLTIDKKLMMLIDKWEMDKAVDFAKQAMHLEGKPSGTTIIYLLQHLASLGEVEHVEDLYTILAENHILLEKNVLPYVADAYCNSGRIQDGIEFMKNLYINKNGFNHIEILFALLTVSVLRNFPQKVSVIEDFVEECRQMEGYMGVAHLWKCYMLAELFEDAERVLKENQEHLKSYLPIVINEICQMKDKLHVNREIVISRLCEIPTLKEKQKIMAYEALLSILDTKQKWKELLSGLMKAKQEGLSLTKAKTAQHVKMLEKIYGINEGDEISQNILLLKDWCAKGLIK